MKRIVSFLLSLVVLLSSMSLAVFAADGDLAPDPAPDVTVTEDQAGKGTAISSAESRDNPAANMNDDDPATFWDSVSGSAVYFGVNFTKEANVKVYSVSFLVSDAEGSYTLQYFRNNRWISVDTFTGDDLVAVDGSDGLARLDYTFDDTVITQQVRIEYSGDAIKVYDVDVMGVYLPNVGTRGEAYATSFKHFDWTPPHTFNDGLDFEDDWHGWEPQYPEVASGAATSAGFGGEHVGVKFTNREYYKVNQR